MFMPPEFSVPLEFGTEESVPPPEVSRIRVIDFVYPFTLFSSPQAKFHFVAFGEGGRDTLSPEGIAWKDQ